MWWINIYYDEPDNNPWYFTLELHWFCILILVTSTPFNKADTTAHTLPAIEAFNKNDSFLGCLLLSLLLLLLLYSMMMFGRDLVSEDGGVGVDELIVDDDMTMIMIDDDNDGSTINLTLYKDTTLACNGSWKDT